MKSYEIKQKNRQDALLDTQKDAIYQLNAMSQPKSSSKSKQYGRTNNMAFLAPTKGVPLLFKGDKKPKSPTSFSSHSSPSPTRNRNNVRRKKSDIDKQAASMVFKVEYDQMEPADKLDYLKVQI